MKRVAIVAVETSLIGRIVTPPGDADTIEGSHWPFRSSETTFSDEDAEVVAAFVGDLDEGGVIKYVLRGQATGQIKIAYGFAFRLKGRLPPT